MPFSASSCLWHTIQPIDNNIQNNKIQLLHIESMTLFTYSTNWTMNNIVWVLFVIRVSVPQISLISHPTPTLSSFIHSKILIQSFQQNISEPILFSLYIYLKTGHLIRLCSVARKKKSYFNRFCLVSNQVQSDVAHICSHIHQPYYDCWYLW